MQIAISKSTDELRTAVYEMEKELEQMAALLQRIVEFHVWSNQRSHVG
jgi:hypothetical protein